MFDQMGIVRDFVIATTKELSYNFTIGNASETIADKIKAEETHDQHLAPDDFLYTLEKHADITLKPEVKKVLLEDGLKLADLYAELHTAISSRPKEVTKKSRHKVPARSNAEALAAK